MAGGCGVKRAKALGMARLRARQACHLERDAVIGESWSEPAAEVAGIASDSAADGSASLERASPTHKSSRRPVYLAVTPGAGEPHLVWLVPAPG